MAVGILVDGSNLLGGARALQGVPDYRKIVRSITCGRSWVGTACIAQPVDGRPVDRLVSMFAWIGFRVAVWRPAWAGGRAKTDNDAQIVVEGMRLLGRRDVDELCVASGDSDLRVLGQEALDLGIVFSVASFRKPCSRVLREMADRVVWLGAEQVLHRPQRLLAA